MENGRATNSDEVLLKLLRCIVESDQSSAAKLLRERPELARTAAREGASRHGARKFFFESIRHYLNAGDTALHMAAAAHQLKIAQALLRLGANPRARNRMGATPLHYACDGGPCGDAKAQAAIIKALIAAGADPNEMSKLGVAPLHRAVRNRCTAAVKALLDNGADVNLKNAKGSTPLKLAQLTTGKSGSGSPEAKQAQTQIIKLLQSRLPY